jgi:hypothetical protein
MFVLFGGLLWLLPLLDVVAQRDVGNPFNQMLPDCRKGYTEIRKKSLAKVV